MKKALITIIITFLLSAGIIFSADNFKVSANQTTWSLDSVSTEDNLGSFATVYDSYDMVQIQFTYDAHGVLVSKLANVSVENIATRISDGLNVYQFELPEGALSFIIKQGMDGLVIHEFTNNEYILSEGTRVQNAEMSVAQLIINEDLIVKKPVYSNHGQLYQFDIHFNAEDEEGNKINIDRIISVTYMYDVIIKNLPLSPTIQHKEIEISERVYHEPPLIQSTFPLILFPWVEEQIKPSDKEGYDWMIDLGQYRAASNIKFLHDVSIDQTQMIRIQYWTEGNPVIMDDDQILDDPYDQEDIVYQGFFDNVSNWLSTLNNNLTMVLYILVAIIGLIFISLLIKLVGATWGVIKLISKVVITIIKIPSYLYKFLLFLFVPSDKRKRKEQFNVNRHL